MRHTFTTMGTMVSLATETTPTDVVRVIEGVFSAYDRRFSLYRPDSELSRIAAGDLALTDASSPTIATYADALAWRKRTGGAFSPHRPDGIIDLNGIVKAMAMRDAGLVLGEANIASWCLNVGGDVLVDGTNAGEDWAVGITDPHDRTQLLLAVALTSGRRAAATSGTSERGDHIWKGGTSGAPDFTQVTVIADDIVTADICATAIMAGGHTTLDELSSARPIDVLSVSSATGTLLATPGLRAALLS